MKGKIREKTKAYTEARGFYNQTIEILGHLEEVVALDQEEAKNSEELQSLVKTGLQEVTSRMRRLALSVRINGPEKNDQIFRSNLAASLGKHGFTVTEEEPTIEILGELSTSESGLVMSNFVYYAEGSISAIRQQDRQTIATVPIKAKGFHQTKQQAALNAIAEAGTEAGESLAKILLGKEQGDKDH